MFSEYFSLTNLVDFWLHSSPTHLRPPHLNSISERSILAAPSTGRHRLHHLRLLIHSRNAAEMVSSCPKGAGLAYRSVEFDRCKPPAYFTSLTFLLFFALFFQYQNLVRSTSCTGLTVVTKGIGFTLCGALGFAASNSGCVYQGSLATFWGSWCFLVGSVIQWYESLDKHPVDVEEGGGSVSDTQPV